jgi:transposase-like protein
VDWWAAQRPDGQPLEDRTKTRHKAGHFVVLRGQSSKHLVDLAAAFESTLISAPPQQREPPARHFRFTHDQRAAVVDAYEAGASMADLAREYGVDRVSISQLLRKAGATIRQRRVISAAEVDRAVQLYESGLSLQTIGDRLGWDQKTIYRHLKVREVAMRGPSDWKY